MYQLINHINKNDPRLSILHFNRCIIATKRTKSHTNDINTNVSWLQKYKLHKVSRLLTFFVDHFQKYKYIHFNTFLFSRRYPWYILLSFLCKLICTHIKISCVVYECLHLHFPQFLSFSPYIFLIFYSWHAINLCSICFSFGFFVFVIIWPFHF